MSFHAPLLVFTRCSCPTVSVAHVAKDIVINHFEKANDHDKRWDYCDPLIRWRGVWPSNQGTEAGVVNYHEETLAPRCRSYLIQTRKGRVHT